MKSSARNQVIALFLALLVTLSSVFAAHESNNYALLGSEASAADGVAIVNYVAGKEAWTATAHVSGLPEGMYFFAARINTGAVIGDPQPICEFFTNEEGNGSCSNNHFDLGGFHEVVILDMNGEIVLSGFFERRGGKRSK